MKLKQLKLQHYRNYADLSLEFQDGLTILTGENAQGKTNLLEAIFLLSLAKSHRTNHDQEMIQWQQETARVEALIETAHYEFPLELILNKKGKIAKFNHIEQQKLSAFVGKLNTILFAPEDLQLIKGAPSLRRRFIDSELGQSHPVYLGNLMAYQRLLKQRNSYLKQFGRSNQFDALYFDILTEQLVDEAVQVIKQRLDFVDQLSLLAHPIHQNLSNQRDELFLHYVSSVPQVDYRQVETLRTALLQAFNDVLSREKEQGTTLIGPHRDDISFQLNDKKAQFFGSQGQQRTIILSLKLAEIDLMKQVTGEYPVLLLDDVLSELDDDRQHLLMSYIEHKVQTFLTTATVKGLKLHQLKQADIYYVKQGTVSKGESM
ncbi:DNA replication/repair protein RecF [Aerococcaceae bacterium NML190938]|nr:DNA replication/repair protein RecF [Aerococcaceae bacterium NML190938]